MGIWESQLRKGITELAILAIVAKEETYGYRIIEQLQALDGLSLSESTVYPALARLARVGLLAVRTEASPAGPNRRYYCLTLSGRRRLEELETEWQRVFGSMQSLLKGNLP